MKKITENEMANKFEILLNTPNAIAEFPEFKSVFREISCQQGIADFIAISGSDLDNLGDNFIDSDSISLDSSSLIVSLLKSSSPRTEEFIVTSTGLSKSTVKKVLRELEDSQIVCRTETGSYVVSPNWDLPKIELWAFELKLNNWKRALYQVLQYKAFANRVVIVVPEEKELVIQKNIDAFKELSVGVMTFDLFTGAYKIIVKPQKNNPSSKRHNLFALGRIASELKNSK